MFMRTDILQSDIFKNNWELNLWGFLEIKPLDRRWESNRPLAESHKLCTAIRVSSKI